jgi:hypothetical protein
VHPCRGCVTPIHATSNRQTRAKQHKPNKHVRPTRSKSLITSQPCPGMRGLGTNTAVDSQKREWGRGNGRALTGSTTWKRETTQKQTQKMGRSPLHTTRFPTEPRTHIWPTSAAQQARHDAVRQSLGPSQPSRGQLVLGGRKHLGRPPTHGCHCLSVQPATSCCAQPAPRDAPAQQLPTHRASSKNARREMSVKKPRARSWLQSVGRAECVPRRGRRRHAQN